MPYQVRTFEDCILSVIEQTKLAKGISDLDTETLGKIKRMLNSKYEEIGMSRKWSWRGDMRLVKTTPVYTTGTAHVINADRQVTLSAGATVTDDFKGRFLRITGDPEWYEIIAVTSTASREFQLAGPYKGDTATAASYTIWRSKYGLFPDFADIYDILPLSGSGLLQNTPLTPLAWNEYISYLSIPPTSSAQYPTHYSINGKEVYQGPTMGSQFIMGYDFMDDDDVDDEALWLFPQLLSECVLQVHYGKQINPLIDLDDEPLMPRDKRHILANLVAADMMISHVGNTEIGDRMFKRAIKSLGEMQADFDRTDSVAQLVPRQRRRRRLPSTVYSYNFPEDD